MSSQGAGSLFYAVRGPAVLRFYGELCRSLVGVALVPAVFAWAAGDGTFAGRALAVAGLLGLTSLLSARLPAAGRLQVNEAMVAVALGYLVTALLMAWPLASSGISPIDAVFHSISALTTTGLSTAGNIDGLGRSFLFAQAWMQWCGGLVIIVVALLMIGPGPEAQLLSDVDQDDGDLVAGTRRRAHWALLVYSALTLVGFLLLLALGCGWFDALVHAFAAVSTGGFSSHEASIAALGGWPVQAAVILLSLAGAVPLTRYRDLASRQIGLRARLGRFFDAETRLLLTLCATASILGAATLASAGDSWADAVRIAPLLAVSAQSTAGFTPVDIQQLDDATTVILIAAMFIGGGLGSTAGGIKVFRLAVVLRTAGIAVLRAGLPAHAVVTLRVSGRTIDEAGLAQVMGIVACYLAVVVVSWFGLVLYGHQPLASLFEVVSATATVGLSSGIASPSLETVPKLLLCADMWMGRLEILAVLVLLGHRTWIGRRAGST